VINHDSDNLSVEIQKDYSLIRNTKVLCRKCIQHIFKNLREYGYEEDLLILKAIKDKGSLNLEQISWSTQMTISQRRDSLSRLIGACLVRGKRVGTSKVFDVSDSGKELLELIKAKEIED
jgi:hypothetical protein